MFLMAVFPDSAMAILDKLIDIAQFDVLESDWIFVDTLKMTVPEDYEQFHMENLERVKYESTYAINNMGSLFFIFVIFCVQGLVLLLVKPFLLFLPYTWQLSHRRQSKALFWNSFIRIILEATLDVAIATFYNIRIY